MKKLIHTAIHDSIEAKRLILNSGELCENIITSAKMITESFRNGGRVLLCGNGGSASDALHLESELVGRFLIERKGLPAIAITSNSATLTALSNDFGYEKVFARQIEAHGKQGDIFVGISTSGNSQSVLEAIRCARDRGLKTIGLLGCDGGKCRSEVDVSIIVPSDITARIQESHIMIGHIWCELVEYGLFRYEK